jgi:ligand-binding sensor domain-containing protein
LGQEKGNLYYAPVDDGQDHIWFGANSIQEGHLYRYDKITNSIDTFTHDSYHFPNKDLYPLYKDANGRIVFGGDNELIRYDNATFTSEALDISEQLKDIQGD